MSDFYRTGMGQTFFNGTMPRIADALKKLADGDSISRIADSLVNIADGIKQTNELLTLLVVKTLDSPANWTREERHNALSTVDQLKERLGLKKST